MPDPIAFESATARMALPLLFTAQANKEAFHNEALARIDGLLHTAVQGESATPPEASEDGECWLVADTASGAWMGHARSLAMRQSGQWLFARPLQGMRVYDVSTQQYVMFSGTWQKASTIEEPSGGMIVDSEARAAIGALLSALRAAGIFPSA